MRPWLVAAVVSGAVSIVSLLLIAMLGSSLHEIVGLERLGATVILIPAFLFLFVLGPLLSGLAGGLASRRMDAAVGSVTGCLGINIGVVVSRANTALPPAESWMTVLVTVVLVVAGHLTGVAVRPRLRPV